MNLYNETKNAQNVGNIPASSDWTLVTKTVDNFSVADGDKVSVLLYPGGGVPGQTATAQVAATKLEEGSTQTLAYQDEDGAWKLLPQPESDYATQLAKCQRYQIALMNAMRIRASRLTTSEIYFFVPLPTKLRIAPAINGNEKLEVYSLSGGPVQEGFTFSCPAGSAIYNGVTIVATKTDHGLSDAFLYVQAPSGTVPVILDANL